MEDSTFSSTIWIIWSYIALKLIAESLQTPGKQGNRSEQVLSVDNVKKT